MDEISSDKKLLGDVSFNPLSEFSVLLHSLDSLFKTDDFWHESLMASPVLFASSGQMRGDQWMLVVPGKNSLDEIKSAQLVAALFGKNNFTSREFKGIDLNESETLSYFLSENCIAISPVTSLMEAMALKSTGENDITKNKTFEMSKSSAAADCPLHFYFKLGQEEWLELDPDVRDNKKHLTGFAFTEKETSHRWVMTDTPAKSGIANVLPSSVSILEGFIYPDFETGWKLQEKYMSGSGQQKFWSQAWKDLGDSCACDLNDIMFSWRGGEWGSFLLNIDDSTTNELLYIGTKDSSSFSEKMGLLFSDTIFNGSQPIYQLRYPQLMDRNKSSLFLVETNCATQLGNYVFFGSIPEDFQPLIDAYNNKTFLANNERFKQLNPDSLSGSHYVYHADFLTSDLPQALIRSFGNSQALSASVSKIKPGQWSVTVKWPGGNSSEISSPQAVKVEGVFWQFASDKEITGGPWKLKNHNTGEDEFLLQDSQHVIYLVSKEGTLLWNKPLTDKILSSPQQVDALRNGKLQMIFCASNNLYILDRKGNPLSGFPVNLNANSVGEISVFDYDHNRNYRILVATTTGDVLNYNVEGKKTEGWKFVGNGEKILFTEHLRLGNDDFIVTTSEHGTIRFHKRNGEAWKELESKIENFSPVRPAMYTKLKVVDTRILCVTTKGTVVENMIGSKKNKEVVGSLQNETFFSFGDINMDHKDEIILVSGKDLFVKDDMGTNMLQATLSSTCTGAPFIVKKSAIDFFFAIPVEGNQIQMISSKGEVDPKLLDSKVFPLSSDVNGDGSSDLIFAVENKLTAR